MSRFTPLGLALLPLAASIAACAEPSYFRDIRPIVQRQCQGCHQPASKTSDLDLTTFEGFQAGGKRGPAFVAGKPAESLTVKYLTGEMKPRMPLGQAPLADEQVALFRDWILAGARDDTPAEARETSDLSKPAVYQQAPVITALDFSPDGQFLAVSGNREILIHRSDGSGIVRRLPGLSERILGLAFARTAAGEPLLVAGGGTPARFGEVQFWDWQSGKLKRSVTITADTVFGASLAPDGSKVAVGAADNTVRILDAASGKELHKIGNHENWVLGTVFGADSKRLVSVGRDRAAKLTDAGSGAFLENVNQLRGELTAVARHPAKDVVVIGGEDRVPYVYLMDRPRNMKIADDTTLVRKLDRQNGAIFALAWSPDGKYIAVGGAAPEVNLYDAETGTLAAACKGHTAGVYSLAFSPDGKRLAAGGFDGQVRVYSTAGGRLEKAWVPVPIETRIAGGVR